MTAPVVAPIAAPAIAPPPRPSAAADNTAERPTDDRAAEHILRCSLLKRQRARQSQEHECPQHTDHVFLLPIPSARPAVAALLTLAPPAYRQSRLSKLDDCECSNGIIVHSRAKV
jgi:hypothetical protein